MPTDAEFDMPWPSQISPDVDIARADTLAWVRQHGLVRSDPAFAAYIAADFPGMVARIYPQARGERLTWMARFMSYAWLLDDQTGPTRDAAAFAAVAGELIEVMFRPVAEPPRLAAPVVAAYADIWADMAGRMSAAWLDRWRVEYTRFLVGVMQEMRFAPRGYSVDTYRRMRDATGGLIYSNVQTEWVYGFELPPTAAWHPVVRAAWTACNAAIVFMNDIHSVEAESAVGDPHNLVALLVRDGRSMDDAIGESARLAREAIGQLIVAGEQVPAACRQMRLTGREADAVRRSVAAAQVWVRGYYDWARLTGRYNGSVPAADELTGHAVPARPLTPIRSARSLR